VADPTQSQVITASGLTSADAAAIDLAIITAVTMANEVLASSSLSTAVKDLVKLYLACHFAVLSAQNGPLETVKIGEATERYHQIYAAGLMATRFGQQAIVLDTSGTLAELAAKAQKPQLKAKFSHIETEPYSEGDNI
jgi:hypothetical protein